MSVIETCRWSILFVYCKCICLLLKN